MPARTGSHQMHRTSAEPLARVRPRRKRNVDGEIPPMQLNNPDDRWPLMFQKRFDKNKLQVARSWRTIPRKEVIQPQVPLRLPCYDFTPVADSTVVGCLPCGLAHRLQVKPTPMV